MASSNIKLFDENKGNMLTDTEFDISTQRLNGLQAGIASSKLQNKAMYQASLMAYAIAQVMMQNGKNANDTDAVSAFVANLSGTMLQKVYDIATTEEAKAGVATGKWMSPALVKAAIDNTLSDKNFLQKSGGTMTGNLNIQRDYPQITLKSPTAGRDAYVSYVGNEKNLFLMNRLDANNRQGIYITPETSSLLNALRLMRVVDGNTSYYNFIHTGNMSDIGIARIATGTYVGTGTCGPDNPNSLNLPFSPKVLMIAPADSGIHFGGTNTETFFHESSIWLVGTSYTELRADTSSYMAGKCYFTVSGNSISWHSDKTNYPETQMNTAGTKYAYIAIG